jgi:hypothetical protein
MQLIYESNIQEHLKDARNESSNFLFFDRRDQNKCYALTEKKLTELILFDDFKDEDKSSLKSKLMNQFLNETYESKRHII